MPSTQWPSASGSKAVSEGSHNSSYVAQSPLAMLSRRRWVRSSQELLDLTQRLLESIANGDWATYEELCDPSLTAFEPEALGHCVEGMAFHHFYFRRGGARGDHGTTLSSPHVRLMGDVAVVSYVR